MKPGSMQRRPKQDVRKGGAAFQPKTNNFTQDSLLSFNNISNINYEDVVMFGVNNDESSMSISILEDLKMEKKRDMFRPRREFQKNRPQIRGVRHRTSGQFKLKEGIATIKTRYDRTLSKKRYDSKETVKQKRQLPKKPEKAPPSRKPGGFSQNIRSSGAQLKTKKSFMTPTSKNISKRGADSGKRGSHLDYLKGGKTKKSAERSRLNNSSQKNSLAELLKEKKRESSLKDVMNRYDSVSKKKNKMEVLKHVINMKLNPDTTTQFKMVNKSPQEFQRKSLLNFIPDDLNKIMKNPRMKMLSGKSSDHLGTLSPGLTRLNTKISGAKEKLQKSAELRLSPKTKLVINSQEELEKIKINPWSPTKSKRKNLSSLNGSNKNKISNMFNLESTETFHSGTFRKSEFLEKKKIEYNLLKNCQKGSTKASTLKKQNPGLNESRGVAKKHKRLSQAGNRFNKGFFTSAKQKYASRGLESSARIDSIKQRCQEGSCLQSFLNLQEVDKRDNILEKRCGRQESNRVFKRMNTHNKKSSLRDSRNLAEEFSSPVSKKRIHRLANHYKSGGRDLGGKSIGMKKNLQQSSQGSISGMNESAQKYKIKTLNEFLMSSKLIGSKKSEATVGSDGEDGGHVSRADQAERDLSTSKSPKQL